MYTQLSKSYTSDGKLRPSSPCLTISANECSGPHPHGGVDASSERGVQEKRGALLQHSASLLGEEGRHGGVWRKGNCETAQDAGVLIQ